MTCAEIHILPQCNWQPWQAGLKEPLFPPHLSWARCLPHWVLPTRAYRRDILWKASVADLHIAKRDIISCPESNCAYLYPLLTVMRSEFSKIFPQMIKYIHVNECYTNPNKAIKIFRLLRMSFLCNEGDSICSRIFLIDSFQWNQRIISLQRQNPSIRLTIKKFTTIFSTFTEKF